MPVDWPFADCVNLAGTGKFPIEARDAERQTVTAKAILDDLTNQTGIVLADEVGMGKTYVALTVAASVLVATRGQQGPVVVMVPSGLRGKWQREWDQFKRHCAADKKLDWIKDTYARSPTHFFQLLDDSGTNRRHLVFMTTGCFSQERIRDPWIKLALIRMARRHTKLSPTEKRRLYRWATQLVQLVSVRGLTESVVERLLNADLTQWKHLLKSEKILEDDEDDPVPALLERYEAKLNWKPLIDVIRQALPQRSSGVIRDRERMNETRQKFHAACRTIFKQWLEGASWQSPLLILDEAHHAKNDKTHLAELFRESGRSDTQLLAGKFQRMLFLTATPFQLGHLELIRILKSFGAIRWTGRAAPNTTREDFDAAINNLERALDANRLAGRGLDKLWGGIRGDMLGESTVDEWWRRVESRPDGLLEERLVQAVADARRTRDAAQQLLRPWVLRHNRPTELISSPTATAQPRRVSLTGRAILDDNASRSVVEAGLPVERTAALPFLLTARAQGELARHSGARAFFAEGLASSYEAFHHTREDRRKARDMNDDGGIPGETSEAEGPIAESLIPVSWYEEQISKLVPSKQGSRDERLHHPKVRATVERAVKLWLGGEKVLVFCYYRETCKALFHHIHDAVHAETLRLAANKLGPEYRDSDATVRFLDRVRDRLSEEGRPFHREVIELLSAPFRLEKYAALDAHRDELIEVLAAYFRSPSFIARYLPLDDPDVQSAWQAGEGRRSVLEPGIAALRRCVLEQTDRSNQTCLDRVHQFLDFAAELVERSQCQVEARDDEPDDEARDPLRDYLKAVAVFSRARRMSNRDDDDLHGVEGLDDGHEGDDGSYRVVPLVRIVHGDTKSATRELLALAFNSPLFPEILVSSSVMGEGIDLHRFCRHVIHHDGCWNPSTLEQQTGRLDRIRCKAEVSLHPIAIYQPFIAGSADEKMFRVLRDRERWFQVVMGQKFEFDEAASEAIATRVPLPESLANQLTFDLTRWQQATGEPIVGR